MTEAEAAERARIVAALEDGRLIADGWAELQLGDEQNMKDAWFAGSNYTLLAVLSILMERDGLTESEVARLALIQVELHEYSNGLSRRVAQALGLKRKRRQ